jgi:spore germination protein KB
MTRQTRREHDKVNKKTITNHQLFTFSALSTLGGSILVISSSAAAAAGRDAWISGVLTMVSGLAVMWLYCYLATRFEGLTLIGLLHRLFGKWLGKLVSLAFILFAFATIISIPYYIGSFNSAVMPETPAPVTILLFIAVIVIAAFYGIESVARATEIFITVFTVLFASSMLLVLPNARIEYILPVLEDGITPVLNGTVILSVYVSIQNITLLMLYPTVVKDKVEGKKALFKGFIWANVLVTVNLLFAVLVLGDGIVAKSSFSTILLTREAYNVPILTRIEYMISIIWLLSQFVIAFLYFYATLMAVSEILGLKDDRRIILPFGLIVLVLSLSAQPSATEHNNWAMTSYMSLTITIGFILPLIMLAVYLVRRATDRSFGLRRR